MGFFVAFRFHSWSFAEGGVEFEGRRSSVAVATDRSQIVSVGRSVRPFDVNDRIVRNRGSRFESAASFEIGRSFTSSLHRLTKSVVGSVSVIRFEFRSIGSDRLARFGSNLPSLIVTFLEVAKYKENQRW